MTTLVTAKALASQLEPYKRLLGILVRQDCISIAVSNPYLNQAEPLGGLMLRDGRLSERSLSRMLSSQQQELAGFILGCEVKPQESAANESTTATQQQQQHSPQQQRAVQQLQVMLEGIGLRGGWYGSWSADTAAAAACQIRPPPSSTTTAGSAAASRSGGVAAGSSSSSAAAAAEDGSSSSSDQQERCSLGQQFLQGYLESLGTYNTFG